MVCFCCNICVEETSSFLLFSKALNFLSREVGTSSRLKTVNFAAYLYDLPIFCSQEDLISPDHSYVNFWSYACGEVAALKNEWIWSWGILWALDDSYEPLQVDQSAPKGILGNQLNIPAGYKYLRQMELRKWFFSNIRRGGWWKIREDRNVSSCFFCLLHSINHVTKLIEIAKAHLVPVSVMRLSVSLARCSFLVRLFNSTATFLSPPINGINLHHPSWEVFRTNRQQLAQTTANEYPTI